MQVLKRHKRLVLVVVLLVAVLTVSLFVSLFLAQNISKPTPTSTPSPAPSVSSTPAVMATSSPTLPSASTSPSGTPFQMGSPTSAPVSGLFPGEVTQYEGQKLTTINTFLDDIAQHPDVAIDGTQVINQSTYRLTVTGLVSQPVEYSYSDVVNNFTSYQNVGTLLCVEGWSVTILWDGVRVSDLLDDAGADMNATTVTFYCYDGYSTSVPLSYIVDDDIIMAYAMNNVTIPPERGFPFQLVAEGKWGYKWAKWITRIEVSDHGLSGYWESQGYSDDGDLNRSFLK